MDAGERLLRAIFSVPVEDEAAAEARIRLVKTRKALLSAPELVQHLRASLTPSDGRTERGVLPELRTPLLTGVADAADEVYAVLISWVGYWAPTLKINPPAALLAAWRNGQDSHRSVGHSDAPALGFRAGTTPGEARGLVLAATTWLIDVEMEAADHDAVPDYQDEITRLIWGYRAASGLTTAPVRTASPRPCPVCHEPAVCGEYFGGSLDGAEKRDERIRAYARPGESPEQALNAFLSAVAGVAVRCQNCGWEAEARPSQIVRWLA